jgi:hypothetical protein
MLQQSSSSQIQRAYLIKLTNNPSVSKGSDKVATRLAHEQGRYSTITDMVVFLYARQDYPKLTY